MKRVFAAIRWSLAAVSITAMMTAMMNVAALAQEQDGQSLFNGKDLSDWKGDMKRWTVEDGAITGRTTPDTLLKYNTFLVWKGGEPADFELRLKYKIVGGNSGVQYRSKLTDPEKFIVSGYQADIDSKGQFTGMNYEERARAFLAQRGEKVEVAEDGKKNITKIGDRGELQKKVKNEDWNDYTILAKGNHLTHIINGVVMCEVIDNQKDKAARSGVIALQLHTGPPMTVQFKDIQLKPLK
jgi:Domain of Unknown Function (DUF1080)